MVDMPTTGRTLVLQQAGKMAAGTFVPQNAWTVADGTLVPQMTRTAIVAQRLTDFLPATIRKFGVTCEFVGLVSSKSDIKTMFTGLPDRKDTLPTLSHIEFRWREDDDRHGFCQTERQGWKELKKHCEANNITLTHQDGHPQYLPKHPGIFRSLPIHEIQRRDSGRLGDASYKFEIIVRQHFSNFGMSYENS